ncbi:hypothetical protein [Streptomyces sp. NPDC001816]|uniref:hypothetical protein n=1 Tax=Streptomyces sp. NPDC001816 TaxID=3364612 RepID=UPI0036752428
MVRHTADLGTAFAGWDFKVAGDGTYWCLEVNPMPAYDWYDRRLGGAISASLLGLLRGGPPVIDSLTVLTGANSAALRDAVHSLRRRWTSRGPEPAAFFTLGAPSYLDLAPDPESGIYQKRADISRPVLQNSFGRLCERLADVYPAGPAARCRRRPEPLGGESRPVPACAGEGLDRVRGRSQSLPRHEVHPLPPGLAS